MANTTNNQKSKKKQSDFIDVERLIPRLLNEWPLYIISMLIALAVAYYLNNWKLNKIYSANTTFKIKDNSSANNSLASNSINFIWGGNANKVDGLSYTLTSRIHNEKVVKKAESYIFYTEEGRLKKSNIYKLDAPFHVHIDTFHQQVVNVDVRVKPKDQNSFYLEVENANGSLYQFTKDSIIKPDVLNLPKIGYYNQWMVGKNYKIKLTRSNVPFSESTISFKLVTIKDATSRAVKNFSVSNPSKISSIISVSKNAESLNEAVDLLNNSIQVLIENELAERNLSAYQTKKYLQERIAAVKLKLDSSTNNLQELQKQTGVYNFDTKKSELLGKLTTLDKERIEVEEKINALHRLMPKKSSSVDNLIALNIAGLDVSYYMTNVDQLDNLENQREQMLKVYKSNTDEIREVDRQLAKTRNNISNVVNAHLQKLNTDLSMINAKLAESEFKAKDLPYEEIEFVEANRGFELNSTMYSTLINQLNTTDLSLASIVSDITIIDPAKNQGQGSIYPNPNRNYLIALGIGLLIPLIYVVIKELLDFKVRVLKDITGRTNIPIIGLVGPLGDNSPLVVINNPKSGISESFRSIRSNLKYLYKHPELDEHNKTILVTSFIGGEGKTFNAMNIASSIGSMDKKTILIGLDLRKPKIFDDFNINNKVGVTDYVAGYLDLNKIIQHTILPNLDVITAGPIPPNPSELILSKRMDQLFAELKEKYEFVIIDSPPIGLVTDSYDLMCYADCTLYVTRYNYSEKNFITAISNKYDVGEVSNVGIIFNDFQIKTGYSYGYGYGYGYGYDYGYGYFAGDEDFDNSFFGKLKRLATRIKSKFF